MEDEKTKEIRYIDLFGGVGGFRLGIERAFNNKPTYISKESKQKECTQRGKWNIKKQGTLLCSRKNTPLCVFYNDFDKYAVQTYNKNFKENWKAKDIRTIKTDSIPDFDLLCAGFPCQAFSIAGKRRGFEDTRGTLFYEIARILKAKRPKYLLLENVKGLLSHDRGRTFAIILSTIAELGYDVQWMVLNSKFFGVPQNRERVFIIGSLGGTSRPEILPFGESSSIPYEKNEGKQEKEKRICSTIDSRYGALRNVGETYLVYEGAVMSKKNKKWLEDGKELSRNFPQGQRVYSTEGISSTIAGNAGGLGGKTGLYAMRGRGKNNIQTLEKRKDESTNSLTNVQKDNLVMMGNYQKETEKRKYDIEPEKISEYLRLWLKKSGISKKQLSKKLGLPFTLVEHFFRKSISISLPDKETWIKLKQILKFDEIYDKEMIEYVSYITSKHQGNRIYSSESDSPTLSSTIEPTIQHNMKIRRLTPIECERLQGFPDNWTEGVSDTQRYKQMGNAVTVNVIHAIINKLLF